MENLIDHLCFKKKWEEFSCAWANESKYRNLSYGQALHSFFAVGSIKDEQIEIKAKRLYNSKDTEALNLFFEILKLFRSEYERIDRGRTVA